MEFKHSFRMMSFTTKKWKVITSASHRENQDSLDVFKVEKLDQTMSRLLMLSGFGPNGGKLARYLSCILPQTISNESFYLTQEVIHAFAKSAQLSKDHMPTSTLDSGCHACVVYISPYDNLLHCISVGKMRIVMVVTDPMGFKAWGAPLTDFTSGTLVTPRSQQKHENNAVSVCQYRLESTFSNKFVIAASYNLWDCVETHKAARVAWNAYAASMKQSYNNVDMALRRASEALMELCSGSPSNLMVSCICW